MHLERGSVLFSQRKKEQTPGPVVQLELSNETLYARRTKCDHIQSLDVNSGKLLQKISFNSNSISGLAVSGEVIWVGTSDGYLMGHDLRANVECCSKKLDECQMVTSVACDPVGRKIAVATEISEAVKPGKSKKAKRDTDSESEDGNNQIDVFDVRKFSQPEITGGSDGLVNTFDLSQKCSDSDDYLIFSANVGNNVAVCRCSDVLRSGNECTFTAAAATDDGSCHCWLLPDSGENLLKWNVPSCDMEEQRPFLVDIHPMKNNLDNSNQNRPVAFSVLSDSSGKVAVFPLKSGQNKDKSDHRFNLDVFLSSLIDCGHKDLVRCSFYDFESNLLYTGSDDGSISASIVKMDFEPINVVKNVKGKKRSRPY